MTQYLWASGHLGWIDIEFSEFKDVQVGYYVISEAFEFFGVPLLV